MATQAPILLLYTWPEPVMKLEAVLRDQYLPVDRALSCQEARDLLLQTKTPRVLFTDSILQDGTWRNVLEMARNAPASTAVVVVDRLGDTSAYLDAMEGGAFDFLIPPFQVSDVAWVLNSAKLYLDKSSIS